MPEIICRNCGGLTNTAVADHMLSVDDKADYCYATFVDGRWLYGCKYSSAHWTTQAAVDKLIKENPPDTGGWRPPRIKNY